MNQDSQEKVCRLCLSSKNLLSMFSGKARDRRNSLRKMIDEVLMIKIERDHPNSYVCINCCVDVSNIFRFRWSCLENEDKFQSKLQSTHSPNNQRKKMKLESPQLKDIASPTLKSSEEIMTWLLKKRTDIIAGLPPMTKDVEVQVELSAEKCFASTRVQTEGTYILKPDPPKKRSFKTQTDPKKKCHSVQVQTNEQSFSSSSVQTEEINSEGSKVTNMETQTEGIYVLKVDPPETKSCQIQTDHKRTHYRHSQDKSAKEVKHFKDEEIQTYTNIIVKTDVFTSTETINLNESSSQTQILNQTDNVSQTDPEPSIKHSSNGNNKFKVHTEQIVSEGSKITHTDTQTEGTYILKIGSPKTKSLQVQTDHRRKHYRHIHATAAEKVKKQLKNADIIDKTDVYTFTENTSLNDSSLQTNPQPNSKHTPKPNNNKCINRLPLKRPSPENLESSIVVIPLNANEINSLLPRRVRTRTHSLTPTKENKLCSLQTKAVCHLEQLTQTSVINNVKTGGVETRNNSLSHEERDDPGVAILSQSSLDLSESSASINTTMSTEVPLSTPEKMCEPRRKRGRPFGRANAVKKSFAKEDDFRIETESTSTSKLNGSAVCEINNVKPGGVKTRNNSLYHEVRDDPDEAMLSQNSLDLSESSASINTTMSTEVPLSTPEKICEPRKKRGRPFGRANAVNSFAKEDDFRIKTESTSTSKLNGSAVCVNNNKEIKNEELDLNLDVVSARSSGLVDIETSNIVHICKCCDKSDRQCKFCHKKFPSIPLTMEHGRVCKIKSMTQSLLYIDIPRMEGDLDVLKRHPKIAKQLQGNEHYSLELL